VAELEKSLLKSFVVMYRHRRKLSSRADVVTLSTLMSVCHDWRQGVSRLLSQLKALVVAGESFSLHIPLTSTWPHLRCAIGLEEGEY